ncbi:MAG: choice-of-anchor tandem repeat GloVer-containing protein, partial [Terriglobales bacterium]
DSSGNLYGTTQYRGAYGGGLVFKLTPSGTESVLYNFCAQPGCADGSTPRAGLALDSQGNLYGTTYKGGVHGDGTVFKLTQSGTETVLYSFCSQSGCTDGSNPLATPVLDASGNVYGTTLKGGAHGQGTVFEVSQSGAETVLHSFCSLSGCKDGSNPEAGVVRDASGNLYGTTYYGGLKKGRGAVFEVTASGTETVLHSFTANGTDGYNPAAPLILDNKGNLYGTTLKGGAHRGGTVFEVTP